MISGGNATVFVSDLEKSVAFYSETLGLKVKLHAPGHFAMIDAGSGFQIGLHPAGKGPAPGTRGCVEIGLLVTQPIEEVVARLKEKGLTFTSEVAQDGPVRLAGFSDPDGTALYLCEET